ncbi:MAG: hypothetical protein HKN17_05065 [Rhodothermales bacterium]|nr:hypothetical protein [Rhodothermales bacterium]
MRHSSSATPPLVVFFLSVMILTSGCIQTRFAATTSQSYTAKPANCDIEVFITTLPDRDYIEIGIVEAKATLWKSDIQDILPKLRERACEEGGDAIILGESDTWAEGEDGIETQKTQATVIRWR